MSRKLYTGEKLHEFLNNAVDGRYEIHNNQIFVQGGVCLENMNLEYIPL